MHMAKKYLADQGAIPTYTTAPAAAAAANADG
jgi:hypothetical protein